MSPMSPVPIIIIFCLACGVIYLLLHLTKIKVPNDRFASIAGLRGVLAFAVFLHHSAVWFNFLKTGVWAGPPSNVYAHFGPSSVAMFFMITSFLFYTKLLNARTRGIDWLKLYISRLFRIMPLYIFAVFLLFLVAGLLSHFIFREYPSKVLFELIQWMFFIEADINGIAGTRFIVAGVIWSLTYEWLFYFSLAWVGRIIFRIQTSVSILIITGLLFIVFLMIIWFFYPHNNIGRAYPFAGGIAAAFLVKNTMFQKYCISIWASVLLILLIPGILLRYSSISAPIPFVSICIIFIIIAAGNDIFGLLTHRLTRYLGMISYSLYLLHGLVLFTCFRFIIGYKKAAGFSPLEHWLVIGCCAVTLVFLCTLTYYFIEKPTQRRKMIAGGTNLVQV